MSFSSYEQVFIVNNQLVSGVMSVDASYSTQTKPLYIAGMDYVDNFISGPTEGQFEVSRYMLGADFVKDIGDKANVSGGLILNNGQGVGFTRGRLLNYTVSCNVGSVPEISNTFKAYGNLGGGISPISRWESKTLYETNAEDHLKDLVSLSVTSENIATRGLAEDAVYRCKKNIDDPAKRYMNKTTKVVVDHETWSGYAEEVRAGYEYIGYINPSLDTGQEYWEKINLLRAKENLGEKFSMKKREYTVPTQGSIKVSFNGSDDNPNAVLGFNYTRGLDLESLYALREERSAKDPVSKKVLPLTDYEALDIQIIYPIKTQFDFTLSFDNYKMSDMRAFLDYSNWSNNKIEQDVSVKVYDPQKMGDDDSPIMEYKIDNAKLLSEAITSQTEDETTIKVSFEGYETDAATYDPFDTTYHDKDYGAVDNSNLENKINGVKT